MLRRRSIMTVVSISALAIAACGSDPGSGFGDANGSGSRSDGGAGGGGASDDGSPGFGDDAGSVDSAKCVGLQCQQHCASTTISGKVYDPAGKNPLYDIVVYVPNAPLKPLAQGASCAKCDDLYSGDPIAATLTDATGSFKLTNAPDGKDIPLVVQIGKWRKLYYVKNVAACQDNPQPDKSLRLPHNHSDGDIPSIAISTGGADTLECLLGRVGLDPSEYGPGAGGSGRIHIFAGAPPFAAPNTSPPAPASSQSLWDKKADLMPFDLVLLSCEGSETAGMNQQALFDYAAGGGRVFASHFHYAWLNTGPFGSANLATWSAGSNHMGNINANIVTTLPNNKPFPKGQAMAQWLATVGALAGGELPIDSAMHNADVGASNTASQAWIVADKSASPPGSTEYFSFDTPLNVPADQQCGRVVYSDLHVGAASGDYSGGPFGKTVPAGCANNDLSPQEKALEFMLFDLSSCVTPNDQPPQPPPVPK